MLFPDFHNGSFGLSCLGGYIRKKSEGGIKMSGLFGDMFDFDHDGEMDSFEKAAEFNFLQDLLDDERSERKEEYSDCFDDEDDEDEDDEDEEY